MAQQDHASDDGAQNGDEETPTLIGKTIENVREMTDRELEREGWSEDNIHGRPAAIVFSDDSVVYAARDPEGNGAGTLFGERNGVLFRLQAENTEGASKAA